MSDEDLIFIRSWVGNQPSDEDIEVIYTRLGGNTELVVDEILRLRLAELIRQPAQFSVAGEYSQNTGANISALQNILSEFREQHGLHDNLSMLRVVPPPSRRPR